MQYSIGGGLKKYDEPEVRILTQQSIIGSWLESDDERQFNVDFFRSRKCEERKSGKELRKSGFSRNLAGFTGEAQEAHAAKA